MYKFQSGMLPKAFSKYFRLPSHQYETRYAKQNNYEKIRVSNAKEKSLLKHIGPLKWSEIPNKIKIVPSLNSFTRMYKAHLIDIHD